MLDLLFLLGDPLRSSTVLDDPVGHSPFNVGEIIPHENRPASYDDRTNKVRIDRTSQLLISMSITIAEFVKFAYNRHKTKDRDNMIR